MRGVVLALVVVVLLGILAAPPASAVLVLVGTADQMDDQLKKINEICLDGKFKRVYDQTLGQWVVVRQPPDPVYTIAPKDGTGSQDKDEEEEQPQPKTPVGCELIDDLIGHTRHCYIRTGAKNLCIPHDPEQSKGGPPGSDATVHVDNLVYVVTGHGDILTDDDWGLRMKSLPRTYTPPFIVLAHELIHALHAMNGDMQDGTHPDTWEEGAVLDEEYATIGWPPANASHPHITENAIRDEQSKVEGSGTPPKYPPRASPSGGHPKTGRPVSGDTR